MDKVFCKWTGNSGYILTSEDLLFTIEEKPKFSFPYESMTVDSATGEAYITAHGLIDENGNIPIIVINLNEDQINEVRTYCLNFIDTEDYLVNTYDNEYIYRGQMLKSEALAIGLKYVIDKQPTNQFSKWSPEKNEWLPVYVVFKEDGYPVFAQEYPMDDDMVFMTKEEWDALPEQPSSVYSLDFTTNTWADKRVLEKVKFDAIMDVRIYFEHQASRTGKGRTNPSEYPTWQIQYQEAKAFLENEEAKTPFLDGFLEENGFLDKKELCQRILEDYTDEAIKSQGRQHGKMYNYINRIKMAATNAEVDNIIKEVYETIGKYRILNLYRQYPPEFNKKIGVGTEFAVVAGGLFSHTKSS